MSTILCNRYPHIATHIFSFLDLKTLLVCFRVCKSYKNILSSPTFWLYKMVENGFSHEESNFWRRLLYCSGNLTPEDSLAVSKGIRNHLYLLIKNSMNEELKLWIKELEPHAIAYRFRQKHLLSLIIQNTDHSNHYREYMCILFEDLVNK